MKRWEDNFVPTKKVSDLNLMRKAFYLSMWDSQLRGQIASYRNLYWIISDQRFLSWLKERSGVSLQSSGSESSHRYFNERPIFVAFETYSRQMIVVAASYLEGIAENFLLASKASKEIVKLGPEKKLKNLLYILHPQINQTLKDELFSIITKRNRIVHRYSNEIILPQDVESTFSSIHSFLIFLGEPARNLKIPIRMLQSE